METEKQRFKDEVRARREADKKRFRANYKLARDLGLDSYEARAICQKRESYIRRIAGG